MKLIQRWVPGELAAAVNRANERGWMNIVVQFIPDTRMIPFAKIDPFEPKKPIEYGNAPERGYWIVLRVTDQHAKIIETAEDRAKGKPE